jgi:peptide chain release factor 2
MISLNQRFSFLENEIKEWSMFQKELEDLKELSKDNTLDKEVEESKIELWQKLEQKEIEIFLSGIYDKNNAILTVKAGAGGKDAQDWANILFRMYQRYCERKGFKSKTLSQSFSDMGPEGRVGIKEAILEVNGKMAYGFLKGENGVHRLVRVSPFSAKKLRHTSFALIEVLPEIKEKAGEELEIRTEDLRIDTYRASGPGGQYVNKRDSAIRITHLPSNISVNCQAERTQGLNRKKAMEMLKSKLLQMREEEKRKKMEKVKGVTKSPEWGSQIRSYVFYPYKMVKDHRTKVETSQLEEVLDGDLDQFIKAEIQQ